MNYLLFTKTQWDEPPRIRHQVARLLESKGHCVNFFQKPSFLFCKKKIVRSDKKICGGIHFYRHAEFIHHKLRVARVLHHVNALYTARSISSLLKGKGSIESCDVVVNFNYDYYFLRNVFPDKKIITIINDDFISRAIMGSEGVLEWALKKTCEMSDRVLVVSYPLKEALSSYCDPEVFFPWPDVDYSYPAADRKKNIILFWGYINKRIDFTYVENICRVLAEERKDYKIVFAGPVEKNVVKVVNRLKVNKNFHLHSPCRLDELPVDNVLAGIMPYRKGVKSIEAATCTNKSMQLLARGIPLWISGMPNFIQGSFVHEIGGGKHEIGGGDILKSLTEIERNFFDCQPEIEGLLASNSKDSRLKFFNLNDDL